MLRRHPVSTLTDTRVPSTPLFRSLSPEREQRHPELRFLFLIMNQIDGRGRAVILAGGVDGARIPEGAHHPRHLRRSEEHTSELQSLMRTSYAVFCMKKKTNKSNINH